MERLEFNNKVERIEQQAFASDRYGEIWSTYPFIDNLQTIKLPDNLKYIHKYAFWRQRGLRIVYMTRNVLTNIGYGVPPFALGSNFNNFDGPNDDYNYQGSWTTILYR